MTHIKSRIREVREMVKIMGLVTVIPAPIFNRHGDELNFDFFLGI